MLATLPAAGGKGSTRLAPAARLRQALTVLTLTPSRVATSLIASGRGRAVRSDMNVSVCAFGARGKRVHLTSVQRGEYDQLNPSRACPVLEHRSRPLIPDPTW